MNSLRQIAGAKSIGTTVRQRELVDAIKRLTADADGLPPTVRELAIEIGRNVSDVAQKLERLRRDGVVSWRPGKARTLRIVGG